MTFLINDFLDALRQSFAEALHRVVVITLVFGRSKLQLYTDWGWAPILRLSFERPITNVMISTLL